MGSSRRYVVGDRFHTTTNPHKSHLCQFHDINLCLQRDTIKTSYQECQNNSKNIKCLRCSTMQSFPVHFIYNYLMDFYHNEEIVEKQRKQLASTLKEGQSLKRDRFLRFVVVSEQSYSLYIFYFDVKRLRKKVKVGSRRQTRVVVVLPCVALMNNFILDMQISNQTVLLMVFLCMCTMSCLAWFACTVTNSKILPC